MPKFRFTIKLKLRLLAYGLIIFLFLVGFFAIFFINDIRNNREALNKLNLLSYNVLKLRSAERDFMIYEPTNPQFFQTEKSEYVRAFNRSLEDTKELIIELSKNKAIVQLDVDYKLLEVLDNLEKYSDAFDKLVVNVQEKGFKDYGTIGKMRDKIHLVENSLEEEYSRKSLNEYMLSLRRHEKDYLLRKDIKYKKQFNETLNQFIKVLDRYRVNPPDLLNPDMSQDEIDKLIENLKKYRLSFDDVIKKDNAIGLSESQSGLMGVIREQISTIIPVLDNIKMVVSKHTEREVRQDIIILYSFAIVSLLLIFIFLVFLSNSISNPIQSLKDFIIHLSYGELPKSRIFSRSRDEIYDMGIALNRLLRGLKSKVNFARDISEGRFEAKFTPLSENDVLGNALNEMRRNLQISRVKEQEHKEDSEKQNWQSQGLARFADILNYETNNITEISYKIIIELVDYLNANIGGFYLLNEETGHLELTAAYAFNKKKHYDKMVEQGEGLVGTCAVEKKKIYLDYIPPDYYLELTSGLGKTHPKSLLLVPLIFNDKTYGVIEVASLNQLEEHEIDFVVKLAGNIASAISRMKINLQTEKLLEESKLQTSQLQEKEEQLRKKMEEMEQMKEEMDHLANEKNQEIDQLKATIERLKK